MYAYGPVPSRRFGRSIGVSPIPPKTCSYSCVYCQLGRTTHMTAKRRSFFPREEILADIEKVVAANGDNADFITFVGDGEPTLSSDLGWLIAQCKARFQQKIGVITNGSLLWMDSVRNDLKGADVVNVTVSAASADVFKKLHRPHGSLDFNTILDGVKRFAGEFQGELWAEVMLVDGVNTSSEHIKELRAFIDSLGASDTFVMVPTRPPAESWVNIPTPKKVLEAISVLGAMDITHLDVGDFGLDEFNNAEEAISEVCRRHPLRLEQARAIDMYFKSSTLDDMIADGRLKKVEYNRQTYVLPKEFVRA